MDVLLDFLARQVKNIDESDKRSKPIHELLLLVRIFSQHCTEFWSIALTRKPAIDAAQFNDRLLRMARSADVMTTITASLSSLRLIRNDDVCSMCVGFPHYLAMRSILIAQQFASAGQLWRFMLETVENNNKFAKDVFLHGTTRGYAKLPNCDPISIFGGSYGVYFNLSIS